MTFLMREENALDVLPEQKITKPEEGFGAIYDQAIDSLLRTTFSNSSSRHMVDEWQPTLDLIRERTGESFVNPALLLTRTGVLESVDTYLDIFTLPQYQRMEADIVRFVQRNQEKLPELAWLKPGSVRDKVKGLARQSQVDLQDMIARSPTTSTGWATLAGGVYASFQDPVILSSLIAGMGPARSFLSLVGREVLIGAGSEVIIQKEVQDWYNELGLAYTYKDFLQNVAFGAAAGAAFPLVFKGATTGVMQVGKQTEKLASLTNEQIKKGISVIQKYAPGTASERTAMKQVDNALTDAAESPFVDPDVHLDYMNQVVFAMDNDMPLPRPPEVEIKTTDPTLADQAVRGLSVQTFDPRKLEVDARLFQFKEGGDEFGVTERLKKEVEWDPMSSGTVVVYEAANGKQFIVDGHQRMGLARRILAQDPSQKIELVGYTLREVDGVSPEFAMVLAARKNLREGSGSPIDVTKILRERPDLASVLPTTSNTVKIGRALMSLHNDNFMAVVNGLVRPEHAAIVARMIPLDVTKVAAALDGDVADIAAKQQAVLAYLQKNPPETLFEAEAIVRQMANEDFSMVRQENLFGEDVVAESLYLERARVLDEVRKILRNDKRVFATLNKNSERLEAEGNQLAKETNLQRETQDAQAIEILQALATVRGPIADAITNAARVAKETKRYGEAARGVADIIRDGIESGDVHGGLVSDAGRLVDDTQENLGGARVDDQGLDAFDNPLNPEAMRQTDVLTRNMFEAPARTAEIEYAKLTEDAYIRLINPEDIRIAERPAILAADMEGMLPANAKLVTTSDGVQYLQSGDNIYAKIGDALVGYAQRMEDGGVDLTVAQEFQGRGIGGELSFLYRSQDPKAYSGGLTAAGEAVARKTFRRFAEIQLSKDSTMYFEKTADSIDLPVTQLRPTRARPEGIFNAKVFMDQAGKGTRSKRPPVPVKDNGDGTFTLLDGNSTYAISVEAGFDSIPVKVLTDDQFRADVQAKNAKRVLNPEGKKKKRIVMMKDGDEQEMADFLRTAKQRQNLTSMENLVGRAEVNHQVLNDELARITSDLELQHKRPQVKTEGRILEKLKEEYSYDPAVDKIEEILPDIVDAARGGVAITKPSDVDAVIKQLNKKFHVIDKGFKFTEDGYLDAKVLVMMNDGQLAEVQFWPPGMLEAKTQASLARFGYPDTYTTPTGQIKPNVGGQRLYEIVRENKGPPEVIEKARADMRVLYGEVVDSLPSSFDSMLASVGIARRSASSKMAAASASSRVISGDQSLRKMPAGSPGPAQRLEEGLQTNDLLSAETAASVDPSIKKNLIGPSTDSLSSLADEVNDIFKNVDDITTFRSVNEVLGVDPDVELKLKDIKDILDQDDQMLQRFKDCI